MGSITRVRVSAESSGKGYDTYYWELNGQKYGSFEEASRAMQSTRVTKTPSYSPSTTYMSSSEPQGATYVSGSEPQGPGTSQWYKVPTVGDAKDHPGYGVTTGGSVGAYSGGDGAPRPRPAAPVDTRTEEQKLAQVAAAYNTAIDKAIAGDPTEMKNLDKFFTGAERPPSGYSPDYLKLEKRANLSGVSVDQQKASENALAASGTKLIRGDGAFSPDDGGANKGNGAAVFAVNSKGEKFHVTAEAAAEMKKNGTWTEPVVVSQSSVDAMAFGKRLVGAADLASINKVGTQTVAEPVPVFSPPIVVQASAPAPSAPVQEAKTRPSAEGSENQQKEVEEHAKAAVAQAETDKKAEQAMAVATANKQSAREDRLKKIMEMRKPYMGGGASVGGGGDAMVVAPITPASQVPPAPFGS